MGAAGWPTAATAAAERSEKDDEDASTADWRDPTRRALPRTHRFRLGLQLSYLRLSSAIDESTGEVQRFHLIPLGLDFAYQAQFLKYLMVRPSFAIAPNVGNSMEAMPFLVHPKLFAGYQGRLLGVAFGYGWFTPPIARKDVTSAARGGLGQPIATNNHHVGGEVSLTSRLNGERGELSVALYVGGVTSRSRHFMLDKRRWRPYVMLNAGWFFGETKRGRERRRARRQRRAERERRRR